MLQPSRWNTASASWTWYRLHGRRTAHSSLTARAGCCDEAAWETLAMNMQLPKLNSLSWQGTSLSFSLSPPLRAMKSGLRLSTTEDNADLMMNQVKLGDCIFFFYSQHVAAVVCSVGVTLPILIRPDRTQSSNIKSHQRWGWLCRYKEEKDSICKYIIIHSLKAFILLQNKTGKICIAICNKRSKSLMWY